MPQKFVQACLCLVLAVLAGIPLIAQTRRAPRAKPRAVPVASKPFALVAPETPAGQHGAARYPRDGETTVPAYVFHGSRPGPVIAILFHGFTDESAFQEAARTAFGNLSLGSMQGTVLALSFPARTNCDDATPCPAPPESAWSLLTPKILEQTRFLVDVHQNAQGAASAAHAFVYLPQDDRRLATYVDAMARSSMIAQIVELREADIAAAGLTATALQHLAPQSLERNHPAIAIEAPPLGSEAGSRFLQGLANLLDHLKMTSGTVSWQNAAKKHSVASLPPGFFAPRSSAP
jgi:hypothetical protein